MQCRLFWPRWAPVRAYFPTHREFISATPFNISTDSTKNMFALSMKTNRKADYTSDASHATAAVFFVFTSNPILDCLLFFTHSQAESFHTQRKRVSKQQAVGASDSYPVDSVTIDSVTHRSHIRHGGKASWVNSIMS